MFKNLKIQNSQIEIVPEIGFLEFGAYLLFGFYRLIIY